MAEAMQLATTSPLSKPTAVGLTIVGYVLAALVCIAIIIGTGWIMAMLVRRIIRAWGGAHAVREGGSESSLMSHDEEEGKGERDGEGKGGEKGEELGGGRGEEYCEVTTITEA